MDAKLNQSDLISLLAKESNISVVKAEQFTKNFFDLIIEGLEQDGVVKINGLGTFKITDVASRGSVNVNTGEKIEIKGHKKLTFIPADTLKENVNQPFAMFEPVEVDDSYQPEAAEGANEEDVVDEIAETATVESQSTDDENNESVAEKVEEESAPAEEPVSQDIATEKNEVVEDVAVVQPNDEPVAAKEPEPVVAQEKPAEPAMVRVPQKRIEAKAKVVSDKKKKGGWRYWPFVLIGFVTGIILVNMMQRNHTADSSEAGVNVPAVVTETKNEPVSPAENQEVVIAVADSVVTNDTLSVVELDENIIAENIVEDPAVVETQAVEPYVFVMVEQLASTNLKDITLADTLLYVAEGNLAQHTIAPNETLTRIAREYFGDKKLWPYIVKYNNISKPDDLCSGMKILIPRLIPKK